MSGDYDDYERASYPISAFLPTRRSVACDVMADSDAVVATVSYSYRGGRSEFPLAYTMTGSSKRERGDACDAEVGELLAVSRALAKLAARLEKRAQGRMRQLAAIKRHKAEIRARKAASSPPVDTASATALFTSFSGFSLRMPVISFGFVPVKPEEEATMAAGQAAHDAALAGGDTAFGESVTAKGGGKPAGGEYAAETVFPVRARFTDRYSGRARLLVLSAQGYVTMYDEESGSKIRSYYA
jgi:hypothetical protein